MIEVDPENKTIVGSNSIYYKVINDFNKLQIDLFENMQIDSIIHKNTTLRFEREANAVFVSFPKLQPIGATGLIKVHYSGKPIVAKRPPWDGGFIWKKDKNGNDWVTVTCEGTGASLWWPNKDHLSDEPDSMKMSFLVPSALYCVSNGQLRSKKEINDQQTLFEWFVSYPINNYNVTLNIGNYKVISDQYVGKQRTLDLDYYVLPYNVEKAKFHFKQVQPMLECFEHYLGEYPFWNDGYALVETPYWGMEHQGAIAYGNKFKNNIEGFDFIIVHESAHEWWGNSVSCADHGEMWIHETFATYCEALYIEYFEGFDQSVAYLQKQSKMIMNREPVLGPLGVNFNKWRGADMYYKGAWMLHTIRSVIDDDSLWFSIIYGLSTDHKISIINTEQIIDYFNKKAGKDLTPIFNQYLMHPKLPAITLYLKEKGEKLVVKYIWDADVDDFNMPIKVTGTDGKYVFIYPTTEYQEITFNEIKLADFKVASHLFYIDVIEHSNVIINEQ